MSQKREKNQIQFHVKINKQFAKFFRLSLNSLPRSHIAEYRPLTSKSHVHSIGHFLMLYVCGRAIKAISIIIANKSLIIFPANGVQ